MIRMNRLVITVFLLFVSLMLLVADEWKATPRSQFVDVATIDGNEIAYKLYHGTTGTKTVVLLYGLNGSIKMMDAFAPLLSKELRVVAFDLPGHGYSERISKPVTIELMSDYLEELLDQLQITDIYLIGYSLGGILALDFYEKHPDRVVKMVLWNASAHFASNNNRKSFFKLMEGMMQKDFYGTVINFAIPMLSDPFFSKELKDYAAVICRRNNDTSVIEYFMSAIHYNAHPIVEKVSCDVLVIGNRIDPLSPLWQVKQIDSELLSSRLMVMERHGHFSLVTDPVYFSITISEFLLDRELY